MKPFETSVKAGEFFLAGPAAATTLGTTARARLLGRIGATIKVARKCRGLSLVTLAEESGIPKTTLHDAESGTSDVRVSVLAAIERGLGVAPGWILKTAQ